MYVVVGVESAEELESPREHDQFFKWQVNVG